MSLFAADTAAIFAGPLAVDAFYQPVNGFGFDIRVMRSAPDETIQIRDATLAAATSVFVIPVTTVPAPAKGDRITVAGETFEIQSRPMRDSRRLRWTINTRPVA